MAKQLMQTAAVSAVAGVSFCVAWKMTSRLLERGASLGCRSRRLSSLDEDDLEDDVGDEDDEWPPESVTRGLERLSSMPMDGCVVWGDHLRHARLARDARGSLSVEESARRRTARDSCACPGWPRRAATPFTR